MKLRHQLYLFYFLIIGLMVSATELAGAATGEIRLSKGQSVYVPAYSNVYSGPKGFHS